MIAVVDTGAANLASVLHALRRLSVEPVLTGDPVTLSSAERVILPGVGTASAAMERLRAQRTDEAIRRLRVPVLGICLGMQLLFSSSEEGEVMCLGILPGRVARMAPSDEVRIPHMGWNRVQRAGSPCTLLDGLVEGELFYFVHSFAAPAGPWVRATTVHGGPVPAIVQHENFFGVQFHPERSSVAGGRLLANFLRS